jgi:hypothetical protein
VGNGRDIKEGALRCMHCINAAHTPASSELTRAARDSQLVLVGVCARIRPGSTFQLIIGFVFSLIGLLQPCRERRIDGGGDQGHPAKADARRRAPPGWSDSGDCA